LLEGNISYYTQRLQGWIST